MAFFVVSTCTIGIDIANTRFFTPFFGSSLYVWASLTIVIMLCTSLGYYLGGCQTAEDSCSGRSRPYVTLMVAGLYLISFPLWAPSCVKLFLHLLTIDSINIFFVSMATACLLIGAPFVAMGIAAPYAFDLPLGDTQDCGRHFGKTAAGGVLGVIVGTFTSTFWTIPFHGTRWTMFFFGTLLAVAAVIGLFIQRAGEQTK